MGDRHHTLFLKNMQLCAALHLAPFTFLSGHYVLAVWEQDSPSQNREFLVLDKNSVLEAIANSVRLSRIDYAEPQVPVPRIIHTDKSGSFVKAI